MIYSISTDKKIFFFLKCSTLELELKLIVNIFGMISLNRVKLVKIYLYLSLNIFLLIFMSK